MNDKVTIGFRQLLTENVCNRKDWPSNLQNVHTPWALCKQIVDKFIESTDFKNKKILTINLEFVEVLCYDYGVERKNIWFVTDCEQKALIAKTERYNGVNVVVSNYLSINNMKFDVIVGNPPYQAKGETGEKTHPIWDTFVAKSFSFLKDGGYLCMVHPSGWRNAGGAFQYIQDLLKEKEIKYLKIHNYQAGFKMFGAYTDYDWYVLRNVKSGKTKTEVVDIDGETIHLSLSNVPFIPKCNIEEVLSLVAKEGEEKVDLLFNSAYHHQRPHMTKEKTSVYKYPCVQNVNTQDEVSCVWYSNTNVKGHFDIPKVIFGRKNCGVFVDTTGEYGMAEDCGAIIDSSDVLPLIKKALKSRHFIKNIMGFRESFGDKYSKKVISTFRKDFWKEFIDADGNEI